MGIRVTDCPEYVRSWIAAEKTGNRSFRQRRIMWRYRVRRARVAGPPDVDTASLIVRGGACDGSITGCAESRERSANEHSRLSRR